MSLKIREDIVVKTGYGLLETTSDPYVHIYDPANMNECSVVQEMDIAIAHLNEALRDPRFADDEVFQDFLTHLQSFEVTTVPWSPNAAQVLLTHENFKVPEGYEGAQIDVMGVLMSASDLMYFTTYVLSNTKIEGMDDPRLWMLRNLRHEDIFD